MVKLKRLKKPVWGLVFASFLAVSHRAQAQENPELAAKDSVTQKGLQFLWNTVMRTDSANYRLFSDSMKNLHRFVGVDGPSRYQDWMQPVVRFDSARILDAVVWTWDTASVYIETFGPRASAFHPIEILKFVWEAGTWKFDGFGIKSEDEKKLVAAQTCYFNGDGNAYLCSAYELPHYRIWKLVITKDSADGETVFSRAFSPYAPNEEDYQYIEGMQLERSDSGQCLVVWGSRGGGVKTRIIVQRNGRFVEAASFSPQFPEFALVDEAGGQAVIVAREKIRNDWAEAPVGELPVADMYVWREGSLVLLKSVPWKDRFSR
ncbi:MAG: hypothetical protein L0Z48_00070 [candidate division Zixibacteria bacterium]|nr:hypothetical protein [candidate division Zixibacteria bacterium]MCI0594922.1 hypothetical protein [candidate division Zixibacteria bacterium]